MYILVLFIACYELPLVFPCIDPPEIVPASTAPGTQQVQVTQHTQNAYESVYGIT